MSRRKRQDDGPEVPVWIVSFSDMVTLLLAFFVLLQVFAHERDPRLFQVGQGSFRRAIAGFGLSVFLEGHRPRIRRSFYVRRYPMEEARERTADHQRNTDEQKQKIRELYDIARRQMRAEAVDVPQRPQEVQPLQVPFEDGQLTPAGRKALDEWVLAFAQSGLAGRDVRVYVIGLAREGTWAQRQRRSARRAQAARAHVARALGQAMGRQVGPETLRCWGAAAGGAWSDLLGADANRATLILVVLAEDA